MWDPVGERYLVAPCKSSTCPVCAVHIARACARAMEEVPGRSYFVTLTFADEFLPEDAKGVTTAWATANTWLHRHAAFWRDCLWLRRIEVGDRFGRLHVHVVIRDPDLRRDEFDWQLLLEEAWPFGIVQVKRCVGGAVGLVRYLTGYLTVFQKKVCGALSKCRRLADRVGELTWGTPWERMRRKQPRFRYNLTVRDHAGNEVTHLRADPPYRLDTRVEVRQSLDRIRDALDAEDGHRVNFGYLGPVDLDTEVVNLWLQQSERLRQLRS